MRTVFAYMRPHGARIAFQLFVKFSGTVVELFLPGMLSKILTDIVPQNDISLVCLWGALMVLCALVAVAANVSANRMSTHISRDITEKLRQDLFTKISYLSSAQCDRFTIPSLMSRLTSDTYNVHQMLDRMQRLGVRAPILLLGGIIVSLLLEPTLTLVLIATLPLLALVIYFVTKKGVPLYASTQRALDGMVRKVQENMTGARVVKALSKGDYEKSKFDQANRAVVENDTRAGLLMSVTSPTMNLLLNAGRTAVIVLGAYRVHQGLMEPAVIIAFLSYFTIILNALMMVSRIFVIYSKGAASAKRIEEVFEAPREMGAIPAPRADSPYHVEFRDVTFSYAKKQNNIERISFALRKGETLGIIGPTGSGKSTILNLLLRFYDPDEGDIRLNGLPLTAMEPEELHKLFGVVFQNDFLFADTIRENVDFGRGLPDADIRAAAEYAQADFIAHKEGGFDSPLTVKGGNLSGGQKQRLLIARALAAKPSILLLDDCSSALDYKTDANLRRALREQFADTTAIIIAQRVSSVMGADHILVLDEGRTLGYGTHAELMETCESYREIYDLQMGGAAS